MFHPMNNQTYPTKHAVKQINSAFGRSVQSTVKKKGTLQGAHLLYTNKIFPRGVFLKSCQKQLIVTARGGGDSDSVMFLR